MNEENGSAAPPIQKRRLGRSVYLLPSAFTVGNIFCGFFAVVSTMRGNHDYAAQAIGIAIILDMLDGRVARMTNSTSGFGLQLDSLADVISFGIAPAILALTWGLGGVHPKVAWIAAFTFTICGAMRLARFNVQTGHFKHFVGLPIPAAGGTIAAIVHFFVHPVDNPVGSSLMAAAVFLLAFLMVSTIRYSSLKYLTLGRKSHLVILVMALFVALIYAFSRWTLLAIAAVYALSGITLRLFSFLRHRKFGEDARAGQPVEHH